MLGSFGGDLWSSGLVEPSFAPVVCRTTLAGTAAAVAAGTAGGLLSAPVAGSDGNVWVSDHGSDDLLRISPTNVVTTFDGAFSTGTVEEMVSGPDGNLWWTVDLGGPTAARVRRASVPPSGGPITFDPGISSVEDLVVGPDGNLWYLGVGKVGRMTTAGAATSFDMPAGVSAGRALVSGPQSSLWWLDLNQERVVKTNPTTGAHQTFTPTLLLNESLSSMSAGPGGVLWITTSNDRVLRMTGSGTFTPFSSPALTELGRPFSGPGNDLWIPSTSGGAPVFRRFEVTDVPTAPTNVATQPGAGKVTVLWDAPTEPGGALTAYRVFVDGAQVHETANAATEVFQVSGLTNGVAHSFEVAAVNASGVGARSAALVAAARTTPSAPTIDTAIPGDGQVHLSWSPQGDGGSTITSYRVLVDGTLVHETSDGLTTSHTITGLTNGVARSFTVRAVNLVGQSPQSAPVEATPTAPPAPSFVDVPLDHPFFDDIEWMAAEGISTGFLPGPEYRPATSVSRAAMSAFMSRLAGTPEYDAPPTATFGDVAPAHPFYDEIEWMAAEGITTGTPASPQPLYKPSSSVSRAAMSAFMHRLADGPGVDI